MLFSGGCGKWMEVIGLSNIGLVRERNEDNYYIDKNRQIFIVCDGMGGHKGGDVASKLAVDTVVGVISNQANISQYLLNEAIKKAHYNIWQQGQNNPDLFRMGTTIILAHITNDTLHLHHVGDSRAYLVRGQSLTRLTNDHTLAAEMEKSGIDENKRKSYNHILTRALGINEDLVIDNIILDLQDDDIILLCSDGLTDLLTDVEILNIIKSNINQIPIIGRNLISAAIDNGGNDNVTLILIQINGR